MGCLLGIHLLLGKQTTDKLTHGIIFSGDSAVMKIKQDVGIVTGGPLSDRDKLVACTSLHSLPPTAVFPYTANISHLSVTECQIGLTVIVKVEKPVCPSCRLGWGSM